LTSPQTFSLSLSLSLSLSPSLSGHFKSFIFDNNNNNTCDLPAIVYDVWTVCVYIHRKTSLMDKKSSPTHSLSLSLSLSLSGHFKSSIF